jgi:hypothetical protein
VGFLARLLRLDQVEQNPDLLKLLTYAIHLDAADRVAAVIQPILRSLPPDEYIRLWASYTARTMFHLGGVRKDGGKVVLRALETIAAHRVDPYTDYFTLGPPGQRLRRAPAVATPAVTFHGAFYAYRRLQEPGRMITTYFPPHPPQHHTVHAGTALLHAAIDANHADPGALATIGRVAEHLVALYTEQLATRQRNRVDDFVHLPASAYQAAIEEAT